MTVYGIDGQVMQEIIKKIWKLQKGVIACRLNPYDVNQGLEHLLKGEAIMLHPAHRPDWNKLLAIKNLEAMKVIISCFFMEADIFSTPDSTNDDPSWPLTKSAVNEADLVFPESLMRHLALLAQIVRGNGREMLEEIADTDCDFNWTLAINRFNLPIPLLSFGDNTDYPVPGEIMDQIRSLVESNPDMERIYPREKVFFMWEGIKYFLHDGLIEIDTKQRKVDIDYIYLSPVANFDFTR